MMLSDFTRPDNPISFANPAFSAMTGYEPAEAIGRNARFLQGPDTNPEIVAEIHDAVATGVPISREILNYRKDGTPFWNQLTISPILDGNAGVTGFVGVSYDTTIEHTRRELAEQNVKFKDIAQHVPGYVYRRILSTASEIYYQYLSPSLYKILDIGEEVKLDGDLFHSHIHEGDRERIFEAVRRSADTKGAYLEEIRLVSSTGSVRWFRSYAEPRALITGEVVWDGLAIDITAEKASQSELAFITFHDSLTGLSNRARFMSVLGEAVRALDTDTHLLAVLVLDLDAFQEINDSHGPSVGDEVLKTIGERLQDFALDYGGVAARIGGDEFAVMIPEICISTPLQPIAARLQRAVTVPLPIGAGTVTVGGSLGGAVYPPTADGRPPSAARADEALMAQADLALHAAKREAPGSFRLYAPELDDVFRNRVALRQSLQAAIVEQQFELHYQPIVATTSGAVVGAEALVRWVHPTLGLQSPGNFIPIAESTGLIVPLGEWITADALRQGQAWRRMGIGAPRIAINLSSLQLRNTNQLRKPGFLAMVERALAESGADPRQFEFELTEGVLIESSVETLSVLRSLKSLGFAIVIDDFGTGHSTFKYLRDFSANKIKIDRSFISRIGVDSADETIIRSMINLARSLGVSVVAEGIETRRQRDFLRDEGCELGQGYFFSAPMRAEDFGWLLDRHMTLPVAA